MASEAAMNDAGRISSHTIRDLRSAARAKQRTRRHINRDDYRERHRTPKPVHYKRLIDNKSIQQRCSEHEGVVERDEFYFEDGPSWACNCEYCNGWSYSHLPDFPLYFRWEYNVGVPVEDFVPRFFDARIRETRVTERQCERAKFESVEEMEDEECGFGEIWASGEGYVGKEKWYWHRSRSGCWYITRQPCGEASMCHCERYAGLWDPEGPGICCLREWQQQMRWMTECGDEETPRCCLVEWTKGKLRDILREEHVGVARESEVDISRNNEEDAQSCVYSDWDVIGSASASEAWSEIEEWDSDAELV